MQVERLVPIVIGDVHGCLDELLALLARAGRSAADRVVLVGDLVAKGPDSAGRGSVGARVGRRRRARQPRRPRAARAARRPRSRASTARSPSTCRGRRRLARSAAALAAPRSRRRSPDEDTRWVVLHGGRGARRPARASRSASTSSTCAASPTTGSPRSASKAALGVALAWPRAHRLRPRRRARAAAAPPRDRPRHRLRLRPRAHRARAPERELVHEPARRAYAEISAKKDEGLNAAQRRRSGDGARVARASSRPGSAVAPLSCGTPSR